MQTAQRLISHWHNETSTAAALFERRWTWLALRRVDDDLATRLHEQRGLYNEACVTGAPQDITEHGAALCRGYAAALKTMEDAGEPDDAYLLGQCPTTGLKVAVGHHPGSIGRIAKMHGSDVIWISPDEIATLMATAEAFTRVAALKRAFPGAEVVNVRYAGEGS